MNQSRVFCVFINVSFRTRYWLSEAEIENSRSIGSEDLVLSVEFTEETASVLDKPFNLFFK